MRIAIDGRELQGQPTGVGRFLAGVMAAWEASPDASRHEFVTLAPAPGRGTTVWEQLSLPRLVRDARADVLFAPAYTGPLRCPVPMVVAIYDVSFAARPDWFPWREGLRRRVVTRLAARRAARVVTTSRFSRDEISRLLDVPAPKIDVVYPGVGRVTSGRDRGEDLVLYVGSLFTRRHIPELIDGFARAARRRPGVRLEIVGDNRTTPRIDVDALARASGAGDRIGVRSYLPEEALAALYSRARAFVFLSEYEGFGLTPLEALAAGVPIVVLDTPIAREVYGDAALYVPSVNPAVVGAAIERILADGMERARIHTAAARLLPRYSWQACAASVLDALTAAASAPARRGAGDPAA